MYYVPYLVFLFLFFFFSLPLGNSKSSFRKGNLNNYFFVSFIFILIFCFRGFVSTDFYYYYQYYNSIDLSIFFNSPFTYISNMVYEIGFSVFSILCKLISDDYFFYSLYLPSLILLFYFIFFIKFYQIKLVFVFYFFLIFKGLEIEFNLLRNSKSIVLFLLSLIALNEHKYLRYIILNLFGTLFHISSFVYIILLPIILLKFKTKFICVFFICGIIIYIFEISIFTLIFDLISQLSFSNQRMNEVITRYLLGNIGGVGITIGSLERIFTFVVFHIYKERLIKKSKFNILLFQIYYILFFIYFYCSEIPIFPARVSILFTVSYWTLYPQIYSIISKEKKYIFLFITLLYGVLLFYVTNQDKLFEYSFFFSDIGNFDSKAEVVSSYFNQIR